MIYHQKEHSDAVVKPEDSTLEEENRKQLEEIKATHAKELEVAKVSLVDCHKDLAEGHEQLKQEKIEAGAEAVRQAEGFSRAKSILSAQLQLIAWNGAEMRVFREAIKTGIRALQEYVGKSEKVEREIPGPEDSKQNDRLQALRGASKFLMRELEHASFVSDISGERYAAEFYQALREAIWALDWAIEERREEKSNLAKKARKHESISKGHLRLKDLSSTHTIIVHAGERAETVDSLLTLSGDLSALMETGRPKNFGNNLHDGSIQLISAQKAKDLSVLAELQINKCTKLIEVLQLAVGLKWQEYWDLKGVGFQVLKNAVDEVLSMLKDPKELLLQKKLHSPSPEYVQRESAIMILEWVMDSWNKVVPLNLQKSSFSWIQDALRVGIEVLEKEVESLRMLITEKEEYVKSIESHSKKKDKAPARESAGKVGLELSSRNDAQFG